MSEPTVIHKRTRRSPESVARIQEHHGSKPDWKGVCAYCKATLHGTVEELLAHTCREFEESRESST